MATQPETKIMEGLLAHLAAFAPATPTGYPNMPFEPPPATPHFRASFIPRTTLGLSVGDLGSNDLGGFLQVLVYGPENADFTPATELAGALCRHFKRTTTLYREGMVVKIDAAPSIAPALAEPSWWYLPVSIPYRAFAQN